MIGLELELEYPDESTARAVMEALGPDNDGYVESRLEGSRLVLTMSAPTSGTMKNTSDDLMACIKIAEETIGLAPR
ncbi:MAG: hypothetical protein IJ026_06240 [Candidatus Methanomethylophilaceae archaeon]|nr:hypothetical protein [Candidatus Methanomethylophilaceae archaeon]